MGKRIVIIVLVFLLALPVQRSAYAASCGSSGSCIAPFLHWIWELAQQAAEQALWDALGDVLAEFMGDSFTDFFGSITERFDQSEDKFSQWFENLSQGELIPSLKSMTRQLNTDHVEQARMMGGLYDAQIQTDTQMRFQDLENEARMSLYPSEATCSAATIAGGMTRSDRVARAMTEAMDNEATWAGLNKRGKTGEGGTAEAVSARVEVYEAKFCDPAGNGGHPGCGGASAEMQNADILPFNTILDRVTIRYDENPDLADAVKSVAENICSPFPDGPIPPAAIDSPPGHAAMLNKRADLARRNTCLHTVHWMAGQRTPGSRVGDWLGDIRTQSLLDPVMSISENPSWNEIMHTFTKTRYQQPRFYEEMSVETEENLDREKVILDVFYLMQLRDLYELNERIAAMLASEVAQLLDHNQNPENAAADETTR